MKLDAKFDSYWNYDVGLVGIFDCERLHLEEDFQFLAETVDPVRADVLQQPEDLLPRLWSRLEQICRLAGQLIQHFGLETGLCMGSQAHV